MHLPPLDVAVYPVVTMSHGRHSGRSARSSSTVASSSASTTLQSRAASPDFSSIQRVIQNVFRTSRITVQQVGRLQGHTHQVYLAQLADGSSLVLKCPPNYSTRSLRHERYGLETERKTLETLREYTQIPVPLVIKYDSHGGSLGSPFLLMSQITGRKLSEFSAYLSTNERNAIDRTLGSYVRTLATLSATQFGITHRVFEKKGSTSWREAYLALQESALRDAEDMLVTIPYESIRYYVGQHVHLLDEVTEPRLVAFDVCNPENVLIDERTRQITGLVGFSNVIWGDPLMGEGIAGGSRAFFEGFGECPSRTGNVHTRQLIYTTYRAIVNIVTLHYRPPQNSTEAATFENEARRSLTCALNELARR